MGGEEVEMKCPGCDEDHHHTQCGAIGFRIPPQDLDEPAERARRERNAQAIKDAEKRAEQSRIKLGVAALFGLRNV